MGCVIPHQSNAVNIPHQTNAGLRMVIRYHTVKSSLLHLIELCVFCRAFLAVYENKVPEIPRAQIE